MCPAVGATVCDSKKWILLSVTAPSSAKLPHPVRVLCFQGRHRCQPRRPSTGGGPNHDDAAGGSVGCGCEGLQVTALHDTRQLTALRDLLRQVRGGGGGSGGVCVH